MDHTECGRADQSCDTDSDTDRDTDARYLYSQTRALRKQRSAAYAPFLSVRTLWTQAGLRLDSVDSVEQGVRTWFGTMEAPFLKHPSQIARPVS